MAEHTSPDLGHGQAVMPSQIMVTKQPDAHNSDQKAKLDTINEQSQRTKEGLMS